MDNSYFIFTEKGQKIQIERFHICTWEFKNNSSLIEFGCEINSNCLLKKKSIQINFYIPWFIDGCIVNDFYPKLSDSNNSRFIFNDSINKINSLDGGQNLKGVVYQFSGRNELCILPVIFKLNYKDHKISVDVNLIKYAIYVKENNTSPNIYIRFAIKPTESPKDYIEHEPHRNAISKVYISRSIERNISKGDIIIFYRTADRGRAAYYTSVITTIAIAEEKIDNISNESEFIMKCRKRSVFTDDELKKYWNYKPEYRPFIINFLYVYSFNLGKRINRQKLLELGILSGNENELRGLKRITQEQFEKILNETSTNESIIIN